jgi:hypothetical protein
MKQIVDSVLYFSLIGFISYTLMNKVLIFDSFLLNISKTGIFPHNLVYLIAYTAILMEVVAIFLLLTKKKYGLCFLLGMMFVFTVYIAALFILRRYEVCGCGGILNGLKFEYHLVINMIIMFITLYLLKQYLKL